MFFVLSDKWRCTRDECDGPMESLEDSVEVLLLLLAIDPVSLRRRTPLTCAAGAFLGLYACRIE